MYELSEDAVFDQLQSTDIHGTNAATAWQSMKNYYRVYAEVELFTTIAAGLTTVRLEQARDSSGTGAKTLKAADLSGLSQTSGDKVIVEAKGSDMDMGHLMGDPSDSYPYVRLYVASTAAGTANVQGFLARWASAHRKAKLAGAASTHLVYAQAGA